MKSIEELARELVKRIAIEKVVLMDWPEFKALKSALEKPVEKEPESKYPKYYTDGDGDLYIFKSEYSGGQIWLKPTEAWSDLTHWTLNDIQNMSGVQIPTAEALAIIEKAKQNPEKC